MAHVCIKGNVNGARLSPLLLRVSVQLDVLACFLAGRGGPRNECHSSQQSITPQTTQGFVRVARERTGIEGGGYRRTRLGALIHRVEVAGHEVRIIGARAICFRRLPRWAASRQLRTAPVVPCSSGGEGGIRTHVAFDRPSDFESAPL